MEIAFGRNCTIQILNDDGTVRGETTQTSTDITTSGASAVKVTLEGSNTSQLSYETTPEFDPLPEASSGVWMDAGNFYSYSNTIIEVIQGHNRTEHDPISVPALFRFQKKYAGEYVQPLGAHDAYREGETITHNGILRFANQNGVAFSPDAAPQLWDYPEGYDYLGLGGEEPSEWAEGVAYAVDDEVTYLGNTYKCIQAHTSIVGWTPVAVPALWSLVV